MAEMKTNIGEKVDLAKLVDETKTIERLNITQTESPIAQRPDFFSSKVTNTK